MTIDQIYEGAENLINQLIRKESVDQGHYLTGAMDESLSTEIIKKGKIDKMEGFAVYYTQFVNDGVPAESASYKQAPFLIKYFEQRGFPYYSTTGPSAVSLAFATINKWKKEGMSTQASKRFSKTGARQHMVEAAFTGGQQKIDEYMNNSFDFSIDEQFSQTKSETI